MTTPPRSQGSQGYSFLPMLNAEIPLSMPYLQRWLQFKHVIMQRDDQAKEFAEEMHEFIHTKGVMPAPRTNEYKNKVVKISGGQTQTSLKLLDKPLHPKTRAALITKFEAYIFERVKRELGIDVAANHLNLVSCKILRAEPGYGLQPFHWDYYLPGSTTFVPISIIMYLIDTKSTDLPIFDATIQDSMVRNGGRTLSSLLDPLWFRSVDVQAGDICVFSGDVPHRGVENTHASQPRELFYSQLSHLTESVLTNQDESQKFIWQHCETVFGMDSAEYAACIVQNQHFHPISHYETAQKQDEAHRAMQKHFAQCLKEIKS